MSRVRRIATIVALSLVGLVLLVIVSAFIVVQTQWFRDKVRTTIVSAVEDATGGRAEIGAFTFDPRHLRAQIRNFTIHGLEQSPEPPLFHANLVQVDLKLLSPFNGFVNLAYLLLDTPQANVIVYPDGHTSIPAPKVKAKSSDKTGLETIVDLAIGHFDLRNGSFSFGNRKSQLNASGTNFKAQLGYRAINPAYSGEIDISPLHVQTGGNAPLDVDIKLPVTALKDRLELTNAQFTTANSHIVLSGAMDHLIAPHTSAHLNAQVAMEDVQRAANLTIPLDLSRGPRILSADVSASMDQNTIQIQSARVTFGQTNLEASGALRDASGNSTANFNASLDLGEVGRLLRVSARPEGKVSLGGSARLDAQNNYYLNGNIEARQVAFRQGTTRISNVSLDSSVTADPHRLALSGLRLNALGGGFDGNVSLQEMDAFQVDGRLRNFNIEQIAVALTKKKVGYNGIISGPVKATGSVKNIAAVKAQVNLGITPVQARGTTDVPVSGRINADYNGRADTVMLRPSFVALPHTRVDLSGELGKEIQVKVVARDAADFAPLGNIPLSFGPGGAATVNATVTGKLSAPKIAGDIAVNNFSVEGRPFTRFTAGLNASPSAAALTNAVIAHGALQMQLSASAGLRDWKPENNSPLRADATIRNADVSDILALAGESSLPITGVFTADAHINGTIGSPQGTVDASAVNGSIEGQRYDNFTLQARMNQRTITVPTLSLTAGAAKLDANAVFQHPPNDLKQGTVTGHVNANQIQLAQFESLVKDRPGLRGLVSLNADATANLNAGQLEIATLNANASARNLAMEGKGLGDLTATATSAGQTVRYEVTSNLAGSNTHITGQTDFNGDHRTAANVAISNLPVDRALALAGQHDLPVKGTFGVTAQVSGTLKDPHASANFTITSGSAYQEPFTRLQGDIIYSNLAIDVPRFHLEADGSSLDANVSFTHPANDMANGDVRFHVASNPIQLGTIHAVKESQPTLQGLVQLTADGAARIRKDAAPLFSNLNANLHATGISINRQNLGNLTATAATQNNAVNFQLTSDLAHANIQASGSIQLAGNYPMNARLSFSNVTYRGLSPFLSTAPPGAFDASVEGQVTVFGPVSDTAQLRGTLELTKLEAHSMPPATLGPQSRVDLDLKNSGNIVAALDRGVVTVRDFRLAGRDANLSVSGTASIVAPQALRLRVDGNVNLEMLEAFSPSIYSSGSITLNASINGTPSKPDVTGRLQLQKASFNMLDLPNGLSNATGTVAFTGSNAVIQNVTGESGGGKVTLSGVVNYGGPQMQFRVQANVNRVHVQYPATITTEVSANVAISGNSASSLVTGTVRIMDVSLHSGADVGNVLTSASAPPSAPTSAGGPLAGMRFDVRIVTAPGVQFRTTLTENLQADANMTLVGTPDNPGMIGRVTVTGGEVVFFGSKYSIDQGTVSFFDPNKITPILNVDLETTVQGVDVSLSVSGPVDKMKLSYRSDPPLQFQQIVSLLASGKTPTTDPVLAAHTPAAPQQSLQQSGASAVLGQAVANPVSGRLQRLFGVSKLSIDPQIIGTTNTPQATLTLQQQVSRDITFTYIQDITQSNPTILRVEWAINPRYSAVAQRDVNGAFTVDVFYKKRFH